ncbi:MAG: hypothetical protein ACREK8_02680, partial [Gemmatimonadales bacterium]
MRSSRLGLAALLAAGAGCSSNSTTPPPPPPAGSLALAVFSGDQQTAVSSSPLATPLTVTVLDSSHAPVTGASVSWSVVQGGGHVAPATSISDANGRASTIFTLGAALGAQSVTAAVPTGTGTVTFTATAIPSVPPPVALSLIASVPTPSGATFDHDTFVRDGLAFAFMWNAGVRIYDVGNGMMGGSPAHPVLVSSLITNTDGVPGGAQVHNGWWFHNPVTQENRYLFIGQEGSCGSIGSCSIGDIHIVDVSDLTHPVEVGFIHIPGAGTHNFWMDEANQTLYAAYYNAGVVKIDVSGTLSGDMSSRIVKQVQPGGPGNTYVWGVMLANGTLYATDMLSGFWALDPATLATRGGGNNVSERFGSDQWVSGNFAYSGTWGTRVARGDAVKIWGLGEGGAPTLADSLIIPN